MPTEQEQQQSREAVRPSTVVVTSENLAEFQAGKLGIEPPVKSTPDPKETAAPKGEPGADDKGKAAAAANADEAEAALEAERAAEKDPKRQRLNMRFSELTGQRDTARAEAAKEREARLAAEARARELEEAKGPAKGDKAKESPPADATPRPDRTKFKAGGEGDAEFEDALFNWRQDQRESKRQADEETRRQAEAGRLQAEAWNKAKDAVRADIPDFDAKIAGSTTVLSDEVRDEIRSMGEAGLRALYYFAEFPAEADKINRMTVSAAFRELGRIEDKVMAGKGKQKGNGEDKGEKKAAGDAEVSKAPKPAQPLKSSSAPEGVEDDKGNITVGFKDYKAARKAGKIK
jgi:hypothetical protein